MSSEDTAPTPKVGRLSVQTGQPLRFEDRSPLPTGFVEPTPALAYTRVVSNALKAYRRAGQDLLAGKYKDARSLAPIIFAEPCAVSIFHCTDGILVRYDRAEEDVPKMRLAVLEQALEVVAPMLSDSLIHFPSNPSNYDAGEGILQIQLARVDAAGTMTPLGFARPLIYATKELPMPAAPPPHRPAPLVSVSSRLSIVLGGVIEDAEPPKVPQLVQKSRDFIARSTMELQVGWRAIEVYPHLDESFWKTEFAPLWAEADILTSVAQQRFNDAQFNAFDPNLTARKTFASLISQLEGFLDGPEEPAHQFLKHHPELLSLTHLSCWSKLPFGKTVSDFVFREAGGDYLLVEIESPLRDLFRKDGQQRQELTHAFNQILDWRIYVEENLNLIREDLGLAEISPNPRSLIVIGRSSALSPENRRKIVALQGQIPNLTILTYDELISRARAAAANLFGGDDLVATNSEIYYAPAKPMNG